MNAADMQVEMKTRLAVDEWIKSVLSAKFVTSALKDVDLVIESVDDELNATTPLSAKGLKYLEELGFVISVNRQRLVGHAFNCPTVTIKVPSDLKTAFISTFKNDVKMKLDINEWLVKSVLPKFVESKGDAIEIIYCDSVHDRNPPAYQLISGRKYLEELGYKIALTRRQVVDAAFAPVGSIENVLSISI